MKSHLAFRKRNPSLDFNLQVLKDHENMSQRFRKTLYYGKSPRIARPSMSLTDLSVNLFSKVIPYDHLGFIDMQYASQIGRDACISPCSMMLAMIYIERLRTKNPDYIKTVSSSDLFLVTMMVATKFLNDEGEDDEVFNAEWATSANMQLKDLNKIEIEFLTAINWEIFVGPEEFFDTMMEIETRVALLEGQKRGWYSYTDLDILAKNIVFSKNWQMIKENILKVITVCSVAYAAAVCILVGSSAVISCGIDSLSNGNIIRSSNISNHQKELIDESSAHILVPDHQKWLLNETLLPDLSLSFQLESKKDYDFKPTKECQNGINYVSSITVNSLKKHNASKFYQYYHLSPPGKIIACS